MIKWSFSKSAFSGLLLTISKGYLSGIRIFSDSQVDQLIAELNNLLSVENPSRRFFYEFNLNESTNPETSLFHCLGAWRVSKIFHDTLWSPAFCMAAYQLLGCKKVRFFHDQLFCKPASNGAVGKIQRIQCQLIDQWLGIKTFLIGPGPNLSPTSLAGYHLMIALQKMDACIMFLEATNGTHKTLLSLSRKGFVAKNRSSRRYGCSENDFKRGATQDF